MIEKRRKCPSCGWLNLLAPKACSQCDAPMIGAAIVTASLIDERTCPHCAEKIKSEAKVCRFCGRDVPPFAGQTWKVIDQQPPQSELRAAMKGVGIALGIAGAFAMCNAIVRPSPAPALSAMDAYRAPLGATVSRNSVAIIVKNDDDMEWRSVEVTARTSEFIGIYRFNVAEPIPPHAERRFLLSEFTTVSGERFPADRYVPRSVTVEASAYGERRSASFTFR